MTQPVGTHTAAAAALLAAALLTGACSSGDHPSPPAPSQGVSPARSAGTPNPDGSDAVTTLDQAFTNIEKLGGGSGRLEADLGNTLASTPDDVRSVTLAFICTGGATVTFSTAASGKYLKSAPADHPCDGSIIQKSIEVTKPSSVGFSAEIKGSHDGSFAYGYYVEKKQLP